MACDIAGFKCCRISENITSRQNCSNVNQSGFRNKRCVACVTNYDGATRRSFAGRKIDTGDDCTSLDVGTYDADITAPQKLARNIRVAGNRNRPMAGHVLRCKRSR